MLLTKDKGCRQRLPGKTKEIEIDLPEFEIFTTPNRKKRKTGTGGIQKQPNGRYRALHRKNKKTKAKTFDTIEECEDWLKIMYSNCNHNQYESLSDEELHCGPFDTTPAVGQRFTSASSRLLTSPVSHSSNANTVFLSFDIVIIDKLNLPLYRWKIPRSINSDIQIMY